MLASIQFGGVVSPVDWVKVLRPWIAGYLVLCLALAGAVGLSPFLHQVIEHGGHGEWHTHTHSHAHPHSHPRMGAAERLTFIPDEDQPFAEVKRAPVLGSKTLSSAKRNHRPFKLPTAPLFKLVGVTADLLGGPFKSQAPQDHEHHSLAQLLASGLVDQHIEIPLLPHFLPTSVYRLLSPDELLLASIWNAQTPDRGPPAFVS